MWEYYSTWKKLASYGDIEAQYISLKKILKSIMARVKAFYESLDKDGLHNA